MRLGGEKKNTFILLAYTTLEWSPIYRNTFWGNNDNRINYSQLKNAEWFVNIDFRIPDPGYRLLKTFFGSRIPDIGYWKLFSDPGSRISDIEKMFRIPDPGFRMLKKGFGSRIPDIGSTLVFGFGSGFGSGFNHILKDSGSATDPRIRPSLDFSLLYFWNDFKTFSSSEKNYQKSKSQNRVWRSFWRDLHRIWNPFILVRKLFW